ncbi:MAG: response regulator [Proteobacteria bacterium]|nr:response regulator [Pseudomonadota bacterium]
MTPRARILVIEDNPLVREVLRLELTEAGHAVEAVPDGAAGIDAAQTDPPDAVVLDLKLPGMDGKACLRLLKERHPGLPVFVFTVYGDFAQRVDLPEADGCFVKSANLSPLLEALGRVAVRSRNATGR